METIDSVKTQSKNIYTINDLKLISFPLIDARESFLVVYQSQEYVPFDIKRVFIVKSMEESKRGYHAHKNCTQLLISLNGECKVMCTDGESETQILLNKSSQGLLIPPSIWATQEYQSNTTLMVITDMVFDEQDYIRTFDDFILYRNSMQL